MPDPQEQVGAGWNWDNKIRYGGSEVRPRSHLVGCGGLQHVQRTTTTRPSGFKSTRRVWSIPSRRDSWAARLETPSVRRHVVLLLRPVPRFSSGPELEHERPTPGKPHRARPALQRISNILSRSRWECRYHHDHRQKNQAYCRRPGDCVVDRAVHKLAHQILPVDQEHHQHQG